MIYLHSLILSIILVSCGDIEVKDSGNGNKAEADRTDWEVEKSSEKRTTTRYVEVTEEETVYTYRLRHPSGLTDYFVGGNYCSKYMERGCWLGGAILREYGDGRVEVEIEFIDTYLDDKYIVKRDVLEEDQAFLLSDEVWITGDDGVGSRYLWAVVRLDDLSLEIVYDYTGSGPNELGTESLDMFMFNED